MLDDGLYDKCLFGGCVVGAETCLCGCVKLFCLCYSGEAVVNGGHKNFGERGGDGDASVIFRFGGIAFAFIKWNYFGCSPRGRGW